MKATTAILESIARLQREGRIVEHRPASLTAPIAERISEKEFMAAVVELAERSAWKVFHVFDSRKSAAGWPDLFMVRGDRAIAAELKTDDGVLSADQANWLDALNAAGIPTFCWRPSDWPAIVETLSE